MSLIEGVGDEVVVVFSIVAVIVVITLAWMSTESPLLGFVILEERTRRRISQQNSSSTTSSEIRQSDNVTVPAQSQPASSVNQESDSSTETESVPLCRRADADVSREQGSSRENSFLDSSSSLRFTVSEVSDAKPSTEDGQNEESESSVSQVSEDTTQTVLSSESLPEMELRQRRLDFLSQNRTEASNLCVSEENLPESQETVPKNVKGVQPACERVERQEANEINDTACNQEDKINIRIKYLNETQKNVQAYPTETIGQFRRKFFAEELAANKTVRFIFNGHDLRNDAATLQSSNIQNNCVLHCLVTSMDRETQQQRSNQSRPRFDMGNVMLPMFGILLVIIWYLRFEYRQFFTATATISLIGVSSLYITAMLATYEINRQGGMQDQRN